MHKRCASSWCAVVTLAACGAASAQQPAGGPQARYQVTIEYRGVWGLVTDQSGTCPGVPPGYDRFTGVVSGIEPPRGSQRPSEEGDDVVTYEGVLTRATEIGLCEVKDTANGAQWCAGHLSGKGPFRVVIKVPTVGNDSAQTSIEFEPHPPQPPLAPVSATASGSCDSLDNAGLEADYMSDDAIHFETIDASGRDLMPTGGLAPGTFHQTRHWRQEGDEYTLSVTRLP